MDKELKLFLGKILGETYRIQKRIEGMWCSATNQSIYGLVNGIESAVDEEITSLTRANISATNVNIVAKILDEIFLDEEKLNKFSGYYDIENQLKNHGIDRGQALRIITYFNEGGLFKEVIAKMDSNNSPIECRAFNIDDDDER